MPGLVNAHDHLDLSTFPPLGRPPYTSAQAWSADIEGPRDQPAVTEALSVSPSDRLFLGGLRNLLSGATGVAHHGPYHRSLARPDFPVRVLAKYQFAHAPGPAPALRRTYRTTDRRIPWMIHAGEGTDEQSRGDVGALVEANVLRQNAVLVHAIALGPGDAERIAQARACVVWCPQSDRRLYGQTADVAGLRAAGVRIGLGSESPLAGTRDALSNLAAARGERVLTDGELVELATAGSAEVARLPGGRIAPGEPADLVVVDSMEAWLEGDRRTLALVVAAGKPLYGDPALLDALAVRSRPVIVDGAPRAMEAELARRAASLVRGRDRAEWMRGLVFSASPLPPASPP